MEEKLRRKVHLLSQRLRYLAWTAPTFRQLDETSPSKLSPNKVAASLIGYVESRGAIDDRVVISLIVRLGDRLTPAHRFLMRQAAERGEVFKAEAGDLRSAREYQRVKEYLS